MHKRENCPICGRANSLSIRIENGLKKWHCFEAGCNNKGKENAPLDAAELNWSTREGYINKEHLVSIDNRPEVIDYLLKYKCLGTNINLYWDIVKERIVFNYQDLYTGRTLNPDIQPKWYHYTNTEYPLIIPKSMREKSNSVILVEDPISACTASHCIDAISLLGTQLKEKYLPFILKYDKIYIALDEDATTSSLNIYNTLSIVKDCRIIILKKDLKYLSTLEIAELLEMYE